MYTSKLFFFLVHSLAKALGPKVGVCSSYVHSVPIFTLSWHPCLGAYVHMLLSCHHSSSERARYCIRERMCRRVGRNFSAQRSWHCRRPRPSALSWQPAAMLYDPTHPPPPPSVIKVEFDDLQYIFYVFLSVSVGRVYTAMELVLNCLMLSGLGSQY